MQDVINQIEQEMRDLDARLQSHPYAASPEDYTTVDGVQHYKNEYFDNMPADYAMLLGRFGALEEASTAIAKDIIQRDINKAIEVTDHLLGTAGKHNNRWEINFDE